MEWKDAFKLPLQFMSEDFTAKVLTNDFSMAFDFMTQFMKGIVNDKPIRMLTNVDRRNVLALINGEREGFLEGTVKFIKEEGVITLDGAVIILIRGWGHLTGGGGLNLPADEAARIQDEFGNFIANQLSKK